MGKVRGGKISIVRGREMWAPASSAEVKGDGLSYLRCEREQEKLRTWLP